MRNRGVAAKRTFKTDPALLAEYNELKLRLDGLDYESYTERKGEFVETVLRQANGQRA